MSTPSPTEPSDHLLPGTVIGDRYEITGFLGEGGFAQVYAARHLHMDRALALKLLHLNPNSRRARAFQDRFLQEANIAANMRHPNVVTVYDFGFHGPHRQLYMAMELLHGRDLQQELTRHGGMAPGRAIKLIRQALDALAYGHRQGIIHKDLKPANLFITSPGTDEESMVLLDYGVARLAASEDDAKLTETGMFNGTPQYLSPEYIERQVVSPALDVYQMGLILIETLTGQTVVQDDNPYQCIVTHCSGQLEIPEAILASDLGPIVRKATALDPEGRYADAGAFLDALVAVDVDAVEASFYGLAATDPPPPRVVASVTAPSSPNPIDLARSRLPTVDDTASQPPQAPGDDAEVDPEPADEVAPPPDTPAPGGGHAEIDTDTDDTPAPAPHATEAPAPTDRPRAPRGLIVTGVTAAVVALVIALAIAALATDDGPVDIGPTPSEVEATDGEGLLAQHRWEEAIAWYEWKLEDAPDDPHLLERRAFAADQKVAHDHFEAGEAAIDGQEFEVALEHFDHIDPDTPVYGPRIEESGLRQRAIEGVVRQRLKLTQAAMVAKDWRRAEASAKSILELDPDNNDAKQLLKEIESNKPRGGGSRWPF